MATTRNHEKRIDVFLTQEERGTFEKPKGYIVRFFNKKYWEGEVPHNASYVHAPSYADVKEAYKQAGCKVWDAPKTEEIEYEKPVHEEVDLATGQVEPAGNHVDNNGEKDLELKDLPAAQLKEMASKHTDKPVKNKDEAISILQKADKEGKNL